MSSLMLKDRWKKRPFLSTQEFRISPEVQICLTDWRRNVLQSPRRGFQYIFRFTSSQNLNVSSVLKSLIMHWLLLNFPTSDLSRKVQLVIFLFSGKTKKTKIKEQQYKMMRSSPPWWFCCPPCCHHLSTDSNHSF